MTAADQLIERGLKRGIEKGRTEGQQDMLLDLLGDRFGAFPESVSERIRSADPAQLKRWIRRVISASTLADVLAEE